MRKSQKKQAPSPINIKKGKNVRFEEGSEKPEQKLNSAKSMKNLHERGKEGVEVVEWEISRKFGEIRGLAKEKDELVEEINYLRHEAKKALIQKQDIIDRIHNQMELEMSYEDSRLQMQMQLNKTQRRVKDLEEERKELYEKLEKEKFIYFEELYSRETFIDALENQVRDLEAAVDSARDENTYLAEKVLMLEEENLMWRSQLKNERTREDEDEPTEGGRLCSSIQRAKTEKEVMEFLYTENSREEPKEFTREDMEELRERYQLDIEKVERFYEAKLAALLEEIEQMGKSKQIPLKITMDPEYPCDYIDSHSISSIGSFNVRRFRTLKSEIRDIHMISSYQKGDEDGDSHITLNYQKYQQRLQSNGAYCMDHMNIEQEYEIESNESAPKESAPSILPSTKELAFGFTGTILGYTLFSLFHR